MLTTVVQLQQMLKNRFWCRFGLQRLKMSVLLMDGLLALGCQLEHFLGLLVAVVHPVLLKVPQDCCSNQLSMMFLFFNEK